MPVSSLLWTNSLFENRARLVELFRIISCRYAVETIKIQSELEKIYSAEKLPPHKQPPTKRTTRRSIGSSRAPLMSAHLIGLEQTSTRKAPGLYSCDQCATTFTLNKNLLAHKRIQHGKYIVFYECSICAEKYISKYLLKYHCADKHGIELKDVKWHEKRVRNSSKSKSPRGTRIWSQKLIDSGRELEIYFLFVESKGAFFQNFVSRSRDVICIAVPNSQLASQLQLQLPFLLKYALNLIDG